ncbi:MAG: mechanosensitive ion channel family protein [Parasphingopyxis sp.]
MQEVIALLARFGLGVPTDQDQLNVLAAVLGVGLVLIAWTAGWIVSRLAYEYLSGIWERLAGARSEGLGPRMLQLVRYGTTALLIAFIFFALDWWTITDLLLGIGSGLSLALVVWHICRAVNFGRWVSSGLGVIAFTFTVSNSVGGVGRVSFVLDRIGVTVGDTRISILTVLTIVVTAMALFALARLARRILSHSIQRSSGFDPAQKLLFEKIASIAILVAAFFVGVDILGIDLTALAFFGGALGLAVGFGMQKTVGNLIAGIILLWDRSIKPGDVIEVGESFGWVNKIGVRAVSIITRDGKEHLIPNEILMTEEVVNWSYSSLEVRVHIEVGVSYNCDIKLAQELMREAAIESPRVLASPKPLVWLVEFGDSAVMFDIRCWIKDPEGGVGNMRADVLMRIWDKFKEHGIEIPFPQRDVHVKNWPAQSPPEPDARPMGEPEAAEEPEIESTKNTAEPAAKDS